MRYLIALLCPPLGVMICDRPIAGIFNAAVYVAAWVTLLFGFGVALYILCAVHACMEVSNYYQQRRADELKAAIQAATAAAHKAAMQAVESKQPPALPLPAKPKAPQGYDPEKGVFVID